MTDNLNIDKILIGGLKNHDIQAFSQIYDKYSEMLFISAFNILKDEAACKDIVQEVFISLWDNRTRFEVTSLRAYLLQSIKFQVAKCIRSNKKYTDTIILNDSLSSLNAEHAAEYNELLSILNECLTALPEKCREVFRLSRLEGLSNNEISNKLGIKKSTIENQINKAIKLIRKKLPGLYSLLL